MITADTTEIFPSCPTFGFTASPRYRVQIIERDGGHERRTRKWSRPLYRYTSVPMGTQPAEEIQSVLYFWHAMGGMSTGFRFKDWADYKSCASQDDVTALDQPLSVYDGSPTGSYQLVKQYTIGAVTQVREIYKPVGSTIVVANELGDEQDPSTWTIQEGTGVLIPNGGFTGTPTSWGGEFYVYARFDSELDIEVHENQIQSCTFAVTEIRIPE